MEKFNRKYKRVLMTGGAGAIGSNLVKKILAIGVEKLIVIDDLSSGFKENLPQNPKLIFIQGDITNNNDLDECFKWQPEVVFHLAANFANQLSVENPSRDLTVNTLGTVKLLEKSIEKKIKRFIYFSSSCVYGNNKDFLREEDLNLHPFTPYAISKLAGEHYVTFFRQFYGLSTVVLRIFNSFGPGEHPGKYRNVIPNFFQKAINNQSLIITGTGEETRTFTYVEDLVRGILLAAFEEKAVGKIINLGTDKETSIFELATSINQITNNQAEIKFESKRAWDNIKTRKPDIRLAKEILGFYPEVSLKQGLIKTYQWFQT